ncbi:MAG: hypothetical protein LBE06_00575 [Azoarcus sp.]|jgi:hypothetical protein|nr:hypothetical protein [Azoarcus sp.]
MKEQNTTTSIYHIFGEKMVGPIHDSAAVILKFVLIIFAVYILALILSMLVSMYGVDLGVQAKLVKVIHDNNCRVDFPPKRNSHPLRIWDFYINTDYWLAEYRTSTEFLKNDHCLSVVATTLQNIGKPASVVFLNERGDVVFVLHAKF